MERGQKSWEEKIKIQQRKSWREKTRRELQKKDKKREESWRAEEKIRKRENRIQIKEGTQRISKLGAVRGVKTVPRVCVGGGFVGACVASCVRECACARACMPV